jgi:hypothetical protein
MVNNAGVPHAVLSLAHARTHPSEEPAAEPAHSHLQIVMEMYDNFSKFLLLICVRFVVLFFFFSLRAGSQQRFGHRDASRVVGRD